MELDICRGCQMPLLAQSSGRNVFDDDSLIKSIDFDGHYDKKWYMKLSSGLELIIGQKVAREEKLPEKMCELCFQKVEAYINFRFQLLRSQESLLNSGHQDNTIKTDTKANETENLILLKSPICRPVMSKLNQNSAEITSFQNNLCSSPFISKSIINSSISQIVPEDLINVDDSNIFLDVNSLNNEDDETNDSLNCRLQNDQENNNLNESDNSADNVAISNIEEIPVKQHDHDIESEIDVCSGEDDDVLELDIQKTRNETVEINSSSESDIEVCDYEPAGKRGNYNTFSPPIRF